MGSAELYGGILAGAGQPGLMQSIMEKRRQQAEARRQLAEDELKFGKTPEEQAAYRAAILQKIIKEADRAGAEADFYSGGGAAGAKARAEQDAFRKLFPQQGEKPVGVGNFPVQKKGPSHAKTIEKVKPKKQDLVMPSGEVIKASDQPDEPFDPTQGFNYMRERGFGNTVGDLFDALAEWLERGQSVLPQGGLAFPQSESDLSMLLPKGRPSLPPTTRPKKKAQGLPGSYRTSDFQR